MKILCDENSQDFVKVLDGGNVNCFMIVSHLVPDVGKRDGNHVKNGHVASEERNVVVFDASADRPRLEVSRGGSSDGSARLIFLHQVCFVQSDFGIDQSLIPRLGGFEEAVEDRVR